MSELSEKAYRVVNSIQGFSTDEVTSLIVDQNLRIAALEAQNKKLVEALKTGIDVSIMAVSYVSAANYPERENEAVRKIENYFQQVLSEVTQ